MREQIKQDIDLIEILFYLKKKQTGPLNHQTTNITYLSDSLNTSFQTSHWRADD